MKVILDSEKFACDVALVDAAVLAKLKACSLVCTKNDSPRCNIAWYTVLDLWVADVMISNKSLITTSNYTYTLVIGIIVQC